MERMHCNLSRRWRKEARYVGRPLLAVFFRAANTEWGTAVFGSFSAAFSLPDEKENS